MHSNTRTTASGTAKSKLQEVEHLTTPPDPVRMVEGLRDTGYQFHTAIADIVDNSIAADATVIEIQINEDLRGNLEIVILDNGCGMDREGLIDAMKYGSKPRPSAASLGKFGLGLKTASTAFCRKLSVVSRNETGAQLLSATWDLEHVANTQIWDLLLKRASPYETSLFEKSNGNGAGTVVIWENVDRLLKDYVKPKAAQNALTRVKKDLRFHLETVYQRFLDEGDERAPNVSIQLDGESLEAWDPFCIGESELVLEEEVKVHRSDGKVCAFTLNAFVLPRPEEFTSKEAAETARVSNDNQGIYIYRENRLINGPDWLKMFSKEPHESLSRVELSFTHELDEALQIDIKKSHIILDEALYEHIKRSLGPARRAAQQVYRKGVKEKDGAASRSAHDSSNRNISSNEGSIEMPKLISVNEANGTAQIENSHGGVRVKLKVAQASTPAEVHIKPVPEIQDGLLWEPCLIDRHYAVQLNTGHDYYHKVYVPNLSEGVIVQGMDALLWALSVAELDCMAESTKGVFEDVRYEVSRILRKLVHNLPEPTTNDE